MTLREKLAYELKIVQLDNSVPPPATSPAESLAWHRAQDRLIRLYVDAILPVIERASCTCAPEYYRKDCPVHGTKRT